MQLTRRGAARLASLAALSAFALAGCHHAGTGDDGTGTLSTTGGDSSAAATVTTPKGTTLTVTQPEFYAQLQNYIPNSPPSPNSPQGNYAPPGQSAGRLVMQQLLQGLIVEGLAQDQGVAPTDAEVNTQYDNIKMLQDARNIKGFDQALTDAGMTPDVFKALQVKPQLAQLKLLTKGLTVTDADVQTFYNANKDKQFTKPLRAHIKRIVVATQAEAQSLAKAIQGGQTFESQVVHSLDKNTQDGDVPQWVTLDPIPSSLTAVITPIKNTQPGQVSPPIAVPGQNGQSTYWLVKVVERKDKETLSLDAIKGLIRANLLQQKAQANPAAEQSLQQQMRDFQAQTKISITGTQYASLVSELTHPMPPAGLGGGGSPFAPAPAKP